METMRKRALAWVGADGVFEPYGRGVELGGNGFVIRCSACFEWQVGPRRRAIREMFPDESSEDPLALEL